MLLGSGWGFELAGYGTSVELVSSVHIFLLYFFPPWECITGPGQGKYQPARLTDFSCSYLSTAGTLVRLSETVLGGFQAQAWTLYFDRYLVHQEFQPFLGKTQAILGVFGRRAGLRRPQEGLRGIITEMGYKII